MKIDAALLELGEQHRERQAPDDFAAKVSARIARSPKSRSRHAPWWIATGIAAALALAVTLQSTTESPSPTRSLPSLSITANPVPARPTGLPTLNKIRTVALPSVPHRADDPPAVETTGQLNKLSRENTA